MDESMLMPKLWNEYVILMAMGAWFVTWVLQKTFSIIDTNKWLRKLKPLYAPAICQGFVWIPGLVADGTGAGERVLIGFWCGLLASFGYQLAKRFLETKGVTLPDDPNKLGQTAPAPEEKPAETDGETESTGRPTPQETPRPRDIEEAEKAADAQPAEPAPTEPPPPESKPE